MTFLFPTFDGYSFNAVRRPMWSTELQTHQSGREVRFNYWDTPLYEWDLTFSVLHDFQYGFPTVIPSELRRLAGFFGAVQGSLLSFLYLDPDDNMVLGQPIGIGDGTTTTFLIVRTFGDPTYGATVTEPVGGLATSSFNLYLNGVLQPTSSYSFAGSTLGNNVVVFGLPPAPSVVITVDLQPFYFLVRFKEDTLDFEKFSGVPGAGFWAVKKLTLHSVRS
jgi:uncharacterized protein (TIGR02217 family)